MKKRSIAAIGNAIKDVWDKVWYLRYVRDTKNNKNVDPEIRKEANRAAAKIEKRFERNQKRVQKRLGIDQKTLDKEIKRMGIANLRQFGIDTLLPQNAFEWGYTCGKLSALRWVLGEEWDDLDT